MEGVKIGLRYDGQAVAMFLLIILLLVGGVGYLYELEQERQYDEMLIKSYVRQIHRASSSLENALSEQEASDADWIGIAETALGIAEFSALHLTSHSGEYADGFGQDLYPSVPIELERLLTAAEDDGWNRAELEKVSAVFSVYAFQIKAETIAEPEDYLKTYRNIHQTVHDERILEGEEDLHLFRMVP
ncbi:hypothetical protein [Indiicoccus explosivorum]|uniref:hypothetical protein n=1 Tax=Indiicoccus explosivorum TaxID=1917864 RepID=UPI000B441C5A|nr:hypothetical protein [Indiicoccus explosivorum]